RSTGHDADDVAEADEVELTRAILAERGEVRAGPAGDALEPHHLAVAVAERGEVVAVGVAEEVPAAQPRDRVAAVDEAADDRSPAAQRRRAAVRVLEDRRRVVRGPREPHRAEHVRALVGRPAVVLAARARRGLEVDLLPVVLPDVADPE